jgi:hypothetical protein
LKKAYKTERKGGKKMKPLAKRLLIGLTTVMLIASLILAVHAFYYQPKAMAGDTCTPKWIGCSTVYIATLGCCYSNHKRAKLYEKWCVVRQADCTYRSYMAYRYVLCNGPYC